MAPLGSKSAGAGRGEGTPWKRTEPAQTVRSGFPLQKLGTQAESDRHWESSGSSPFFSDPPPVNVIATSTHWGKTELVLKSDPLLPPKSVGTHRLYKVTPTQGHSFKTTRSNLFHLISEMEKGKQNERQRNWFQLKEQEKATENQNKKERK